jgi:hypothetical protein
LRDAAIADPSRFAAPPVPIRVAVRSRAFKHAGAAIARGPKTTKATISNAESVHAGGARVLGEAEQRRRVLRESNLASNPGRVGT